MIDDGLLGDEGVAVDLSLDISVFEEVDTSGIDIVAAGSKSLTILM